MYVHGGYGCLSLETESSLSYGNLMEHSITSILAGFKLACHAVPSLLMDLSICSPPPLRELAVVNW
jgi:hypothetical protein